MQRARRRLPPDTLARLRWPRDVRLSPEGRQVVFAAARLDVARDRTTHTLVHVDVRTGTARALHPGGADDRAPCWTPDARAVLFLSDRGGATNLWRLEITSGRSERLTNLHGEVVAPRLSPAGTHVAFLHAPAEPTADGPALCHRRAADTRAADAGLARAPWLELWVLELRTRRLRRLTRGAAHACEPAWSPDGTLVAFVAHRMPLPWRERRHGDLCVVSRRGGAVRVLAGPRGPKFSPAWSPDGKALAYVGRAESDTASTLRLWTVPVRGGRPRDVLGDQDLACGDVCVADANATDTVHPPVWSADGRRLFFLASRAGSVDVYAVGVRGGAPRPMTSGRHQITAFSPSRNGRVWALVRTDPLSPGDVFVARFGTTRRGNGMRRLTRLNAAAVRGAGLVRPRAFRLRSPQGHTLPGFVLRARGARRAPAVLVLHADPGTMTGWSFVFEFQALVAAGYHVFVPNLRGSAGYGRDFQRALTGKWGFEDHNDLDAVADWVAARAFVDPERLALVGRGHGGFLTHWALGHSGRFRCAISTAGPVHFVSLFGTSASGRHLAAEFLAPPWEMHERYWRTSPLAYVGHMRSPLLLLSGDDDRHCPPAQAEELFAALALRQRDVEWVSFAGAAHDFDRSGPPRARLERLHRMLDWLRRKL